MEVAAPIAQVVPLATTSECVDWADEPPPTEVEINQTRSKLSSLNQKINKTSQPRLAGQKY